MTSVKGTCLSSELIFSIIHLFHEFTPSIFFFLLLKWINGKARNCIRVVFLFMYITFTCYTGFKETMTYRLYAFRIMTSLPSVRICLLIFS